MYISGGSVTQLKFVKIDDQRNAFMVYFYLHCNVIKEICAIKTTYSSHDLHFYWKSHIKQILLRNKVHKVSGTRWASGPGPFPRF